MRARVDRASAGSAVTETAGRPPAHDGARPERLTEVAAESPGPAPPVAEQPDSRTVRQTSSPANRRTVNARGDGRGSMTSMLPRPSPRG
ncbi:hypothetical protein ACFV06_16790, partial [Streptomyces sp. NPDC059618]|uniref:hypothetical protein n=1 Tax=Streptomyces sp. NPDC059618 TaxID=3346887 RepID=UPI0036D02395